MSRLLLTLALLGAGTTANATVWHCTNKDMEVGCNVNGCDALPRGDFTPMSINFTDDGYVYACMYSGCWEGQGEAFRSKRFLSIHAHNLMYSTDPNPGEMREDVALLVDLDDNIALMKVGTYAQPLICTVDDEAGGQPGLQQPAPPANIDPVPAGE